MNRRIASCAVLKLLLIGILTSGIGIASVESGPSTWTVDDDGPADFHSIQEAISSPQVVDGDTIFVYNGTYYEHVVVNKSLSLVGESREITTIDGSGIGNVMNVTANATKIEGFTIQNSGNLCHWDLRESGICVLNVSNCIISNSNIVDCEIGIYLRGENNTVCENHIANNNDGIWLYSSSNNTISRNNITNNSSHGMELHYSTNNILRNNVMVDNSINFEVSGHTLPHYVNDVDTSNTVHGRPVHYWVGKRDAVVPLDAGYVVLVNCTNMKVENLTLTQGKILLAYTNHTTIVGNNLTEPGIELLASSYNIIKHNNVTNIDFGPESRIELNQFSSNNRISANNLVNSAISLGFSSNNRISTNNIVDERGPAVGIGLILFSSSNNRVYGNNITNNGYGICLSSSSNNSIYHNNFINNDYPVDLHDTSINTWDDGYPSGGNYWTDFGVDLNNDGISDYPYIIGENNRDNYPLMKPYTQPKGDLNFDLIIDVYDMIIWSAAFQSQPEYPNWNSKADLNQDDIIDIFDGVIIAIDYGKEL